MNRVSDGLDLDFYFGFGLVSNMVMWHVCFRLIGTRSITLSAVYYNQILKVLFFSNKIDNMVCILYYPQLILISCIIVFWLQWKLFSNTTFFVINFIILSNIYEVLQSNKVWTKKFTKILYTLTFDRQCRFDILWIIK